MNAVDSVPELCQRLISSAFQRCRVSEELCRLSVVLNGSRFCSPAVTRISSSCDEDISNHNLNLKQGNSVNWMKKLPSIPKNGLRFSGTEVCLNVLEKTEFLRDKICSFIQKMLILNIPNVGFELLVHHEDTTGLRLENVFRPNECSPSSFPTSSLEHLESGFVDYVLRHRHNVTRDSGSHTSTMEHLKTGIGIENSRSSGLVMEAVITFSDFLDHVNPCMMECGPRTEVLYFRDFSPSKISKSSLHGLMSIDWKSYGLKLGKIVGQEDCLWLEWEKLPSSACIDLVFHCYEKRPMRQKSYSIRTILKKAAKLALDDLKEKHTGFLLSDRTVKIRSYAPDLAKTLAGLILSSNDMEFQEECLSLLGLRSQEVGDGKVEECIKDKIISVIELNDRKPQGCKDAAPFLFKYGDSLELDLEEDHDEVEGTFDSFRLQAPSRVRAQCE
ncbi:hypothetical protein SAY87_016901 [Trapa incisa]|uniref:Type 2 DNA topoisomerase 6 subunit B-like n=1 Tax=Trapa incisa TaxID=236973 RepID=A0AAN7L9E0_9MYRT|nr:hypothetical protein SAY87_016901 [Trapa incisa]